MTYRRADSADQAGRIFDRLVSAFSKDRVFKDVDYIPAGADFRRVIQDALQRSDIVLLILGPSWSSITEGQGRRRLDDENDYVRLEVEIALRLGKVIIPVLVRGAVMPTPSELPVALKDIAFRHALSVRPDPDFHRDMDRLIHAIKAGKAERYQAKPPARTQTVQRRTYALALLGLFVTMVAVWGLLSRTPANQPEPKAPQIPSKSPPATHNATVAPNVPVAIPQVPSKSPPGPIPTAPPAPKTRTAQSGSVRPSGQSMIQPSRPGDDMPPGPPRSLTRQGEQLTHRESSEDVPPPPLISLSKHEKSM